MAVACSGSDQADSATPAFPNHRPKFENAGRRLGYVPNRNSDTVSVLDLDAMTLLASVPIGRDPVDIDGPRRLALDPADGLAYVALSYPFSITSAHAVAQGATQRAGYVQALNLLDLSIAGELRVDPKAADVAFSAASGRLAVAHADDSRALQADLEARRANLVFVERASLLGKGSALALRVATCAVPSTLEFDSQGERVFVACTGEDSIAVVDAVSQTVISRVPAGSGPVNKPYGLVLDRARERLLVSNQVSRTVAVFDLSDSPQLLSSHSAQGVPMFPALISDSTLAVPFQQPNGAALFDITSGEKLLELQYSDADCTNPAEFSATRDNRVFLVCEGDHYHPGTVAEVEPATLAISSSVAVELYPERMTIREP